LSLADRWDRFWFNPVSTATLGVFRIVYGIVLFAWTVAITPDAKNFFSQSGVLPVRRSRGLVWSPLSWFGSDVAVFVVIAALVVAAVCIVLGYRYRIASVVAFVMLITLIRRNPWVFNSGDSLLRNIALFMSFAPAGAALSLDRWRRARESFWLSPARAPWALRLIQIQISMVYIFTVWAKARGDRWVSGTAVAESMRVGDIARFGVPFRITDSVLLANVLTYGTLAAELALAILIWNRHLRPWVVALGISLHLFIEVTLALGFFSTIMIMSYLTFVPEDAMERFLARLRQRLRRSRLSGVRRIAEAGAGAAGQPEALIP
jgi:uncharacterized membrane protein YphA (DoxX/SURF4 family)